MITATAELAPTRTVQTGDMDPRDSAHGGIVVPLHEAWAAADDLKQAEGKNLSGDPAGWGIVGFGDDGSLDELVGRRITGVTVLVRCSSGDAEFPNEVMAYLARPGEVSRFDPALLGVDAFPPAAVLTDFTSTSPRTYRPHGGPWSIADLATVQLGVTHDGGPQSFSATTDRVALLVTYAVSPYSRRRRRRWFRV